MFGRRKRREDEERAEAEGARVQAGFDDNLRAQQELLGRGIERAASVTAVAVTGTALGGQLTEVAVTATVHAPGGERFDATVPVYLHEGDRAPDVGDAVAVLYDPADRTAVRAATMWDNPGLADLNAVEDFSARCQRQLADAEALTSTGRLAVATITSVAEAAAISPFGDGRRQVEWTVTATLDGPDGTPATVVFPIFDVNDLAQETPAVGREVAVAVDPDRSDRVLPAGAWWSPVVLDRARGIGPPAVRWVVPAECPNCGAPVDQSVQSQAEHPGCGICSTPLPCTPFR